LTKKYIGWPGRCAVEGAEVALWYGLAEYLCYVEGFLLRSHRVMLAAQWRGTVIIFGIFVVLGVLAGLALSRIIQPGNIYKLRRALLSGILLLFAAGLPIASFSLTHKISVAAVTLLIAVSIYAKIPRLRTDLRFVKFPLIPFTILIFSAWVTTGPLLESFSLPLELLIALPLEAAMIVASIAAIRALEFGAERFAWAPALGQACKALAVLALIFGPSIMSSYAEGRQPVWPPVTGGSRPNVILITLDTVSAKHMGIYGYSRENTPHLRELLKEATLYTDFIAAAPLTLTSHASIFTGLYPQSHGAYKWFDRYTTGKPLSTNIPTLAEILSASGYRTMAVAANRYYLGQEFGTLRGFQFIDWFAPPVLVAPERDYLLRNRLRDILRFGLIPRTFDSNTVPAETISQRAFGLLDGARNTNAPFFLFLNYMDAHVPYLPPPPYDHLYPGQDYGFTLDNYSNLLSTVDRDNKPLDARSRNHMVSQYDGAIAYLDAKMGELIAYLKQNGQFDQTLIVITSDHGEAFGARNILGHDSSVYQDQVAIPLIVKYPGQTEAKTVTNVASHVDLMPTVLDVAGAPLPAGLEGVDLQRLDEARERIVVAEMHGSALFQTPRFSQIKWALFKGSRKMIYSDRGMRELYDLSVDPDESHNLYNHDSAETAEMRERLVDWSMRTKPRYYDAVTADREVLKRLESLGYAHQGAE
jgi:arylsulfatase A-like enzyme